MFIPFQILFSYTLQQNTEQSSHSRTIGPCWLSNFLFLKEHSHKTQICSWSDRRVSLLEQRHVRGKETRYTWKILWRDTGQEQEDLLNSRRNMYKQAKGILWRPSEAKKDFRLGQKIFSFFFSFQNKHNQLFYRQGHLRENCDKIGSVGIYLSTEYKVKHGRLSLYFSCADNEYSILELGFLVTPPQIFKVSVQNRDSYQSVETY